MVKKLQEAIRLERYKIDAATEGALNAAEKRDTKIYHPAHNRETGGALPTIFLGQMAYWWHQMGRKPFYKFIKPCNHSLYKPGDSWVEELGVGASTLANYFTRLGRKLKAYERDDWQSAIGEANRLELAGEAGVVYFIYWTNRADNLTHWAFNDEAYLRMRLRAYRLLPNLEVAGTNLEVVSTDLEAAGTDLEVVSQKSGFLISETTHRLPIDYPEIPSSSSNNNNNGQNVNKFTNKEREEEGKKELLVEIAKLPNDLLYDVVLEAWGRQEVGLSVKDRNRVLDAVMQIHQMGYADDGAMVADFGFDKWWFSHSRIGTLRGERPNTPQTIVDGWTDYAAFCSNDFSKHYVLTKTRKPAPCFFLPTVKDDLAELAERDISFSLNERRKAHDFFAGAITLEEYFGIEPFDAEKVVASVKTAEEEREAKALKQSIQEEANRLGLQPVWELWESF